MSETERITLVNLIKTVDSEAILRMRMRKDSKTQEKRRMLWKQIVPAFNEICGNDFDKEKLDRALKRIKMNTNLKAHALLYDENDDNHTICRIKDERSDEFGINYTQDEAD